MLRRQVIAGTEIVELNSPLTVMYWIEWGWVEIEAAVVTAKNTTAAWEADPGEFIGAVSAATAKRPGASLQGVMDTFGSSMMVDELFLIACRRLCPFKLLLSLALGLGFRFWV